jgi:hypothetical protein
MGKRLKWGVCAGLLLISGFTGPREAEAQTGPGKGPAVMVYVRNYAGVQSATLSEAEEVAGRIYQKAGIEIRWADIGLSKQAVQPDSNVQVPFRPEDFQLNILSQEMSSRYHLPDRVMGLAPGKGADRNMILVFDNKVEALYQGLFKEFRNGDMNEHVCKSQILGYTIAHELGHILLNLQEHTAHGIMSGQWNFVEFQEISEGLLLFSPQQADVIRQSAGKRNLQQEVAIAN